LTVSQIGVVEPVLGASVFEQARVLARVTQLGDILPATADDRHFVGFAMEDPDWRVAHPIFISEPDVTACWVKREMGCKVRRSHTVALLESGMACPKSRAASEGEPHQRDSRNVDARVGRQEIPCAIDIREHAGRTDRVRTAADARDAAPGETVDHERGDAELDKTSAPVRFRSRDARTAVGYDHGGNPTGTLREPQNAKDRCRRTDLRGGHERRDKQAAGERETLEIDYFDLVLRRSRWRSHERDRCHANDAQDRRAGYLVKDLQIGQPTNSEASRMVSVRFSLRVASDWWRIFQPPPIFMMFDVVRQGCQECI